MTLESLLQIRADTNHLPVEEAIAEQGRIRAKFGKHKYGVTLDEAPLSELEILEHAKLEAMDLIRYIEVRQRQIEKGME